MQQTAWQIGIRSSQLTVVELPPGGDDRVLDLVERHRPVGEQGVEEPEHERLDLARPGAGAAERRVGEEAAAVDLPLEGSQLLAHGSSWSRRRAIAASRDAVSASCS